MPTYLLAHDIGTSGNKATLYTTDGALVKSVTYGYGLKSKGGVCAEQDPLEWWRAVCESTRELVRHVNPADIAAVSFSGHMMGCVCVDKNGEPLRDSLIWADMRSSKEEAMIRAEMSDEHFYRITGNRLSPSYSATKLMWVRENEPEVYNSTYKMLNAKDFIILKLTGKFVTDPSDASLTCLMDINTLEWSHELIKACGLEKDMLPEVMSSVAIAGGVTDTAARECGLLAGTPVVCGGGDGACAAVGTGSVAQNQANLSLGTSSWISFASKKPVFDGGMMTFNFAHLVPGYIVPCGSMQTGGGALSWAVNTFGAFGRDKADIDKNALYKNVCAAVEASPIGARGLLFLPYLMGERSPRWNSMAKGSFVGLTMEHNTGDMLRAVMEGVGMNLSIILEAFRRSGANIDRLTAIGGGVRNPIWRQILSDILGVTIDIPNYLEEATSMGAAIAAGVGIGAFEDFNVIGKFLKNEHTYTPDLGKKTFYDGLKPIFDKCYFELVDINARLHEISTEISAPGTTI